MNGFVSEVTWQLRLWGIVDSEVLTSVWCLPIVRHVPQYQTEPEREGSHDRERIVAAFQALADPTRLAVVERLSVGPASTTELARPFEMALPSFIQHLGVLERAGIVGSQKSGRVRVYQLLPDSLALAASWLGTYRNHWERRLDQLDALLLGETTSQTSQATTPPISTTSQETSP